MLSSTMQQIVQLDATLSALLVPPGLCAHMIPLIQPLPPHYEPGKTWSESEELFLKWWTTVQRLRERLFVLFEHVILTDLDFCNTAHVEQGMWKSVFYTILESLRSWIENPDTTKYVIQFFTHFNVLFYERLSVWLIKPPSCTRIHDGNNASAVI